MKKVTRIVSIATALGLVACATAPAGDGRGDSFTSGEKADGFGFDEASPEAIGVLRVANELTRAQLDDEAALNATAAKEIIAFRAGSDRRLGTSDDRAISSLSVLDGIDFVGPFAFRALFRYAEENSFIDAYRARLPARERLIAIGDLHGDLDSTRRALVLGGAIDENDNWTGGDLVVVQLGDTLDRGDDEKEILELTRRLELEARAAGGAYIMILGNHEIMNADGDYRYVTSKGFSDYSDATGIRPDDPRVRRLPLRERGRAAAFLRGGPEARRFARHNIAVQVGDVLFVHGGLTASHIDRGLEKINHDARAWLLWDDLETPEELLADDGPIWNRDLADDASLECDAAAEMLTASGATTIVLGHTVQEGGVTSACRADGIDSVWRADVGLSKFYKGPIEVLELTDEAITVFAEE